MSDVEATKVDSSKKLSGAGWVSEFPTSNTVSDLDSTFGGNVQTFIDALKVAGATVKINATKRPAERAYLMHWAWKIAKTNHDASKVPAKAGVNINWWHGNQTDSKKAAQEMVDKYEIDNLKVAPSLYGRHIYGKAIDMEISWGGDLKIRAAGGIERIIKSSPKDNTNPDLIAVGKTYGVVHFTNVDKDKVHWSTDGH
ncbi:MAG: peptidoglycan-binding domain-containing protein [Chloroflexi bacterium]|nr:peptidoglycan-binding domain-containing protein [Chloroflexota bacterium]